MQDRILPRQERRRLLGFEGEATDFGRELFDASQRRPVFDASNRRSDPIAGIAPDRQIRDRAPLTGEDSPAPRIARIDGRRGGKDQLNFAADKRQLAYAATAPTAFMRQVDARAPRAPAGSSRPRGQRPRRLRAG